VKKRAGFVVACVAALTMCSCGYQAEAERARIEAEAARAEAERAQAQAEAEAERAKAEAAKQKAMMLEAELRDRWNEVGPKYAVGGFNTFRWPGPNAFPHPTFKGGSNEAYTTFAKALVEFLETGNNFEFMEKNNLFTMELGFGGSGKIKIVEFADQLARPGSLASGDEANQKKLAALVAKMKTPRKV
jgi:hypothetical protein